MKKYLYTIIVLFGVIFSAESWASPVVQSCGNFGGSASGCAKCYKETEYVYGCNQFQTCSQYYGLTYLSDTMVNTGNVTKVMYTSPLNRAGRVEFVRLQNQTDWSLSSNSMFRTPATFSPLYTGATGTYYMLAGGSSVKWIETKPGSFIRLNGVSAGASRATPAYRVSFIPRTYDSLGGGNLGPAVDHQQCLFIYSRFCGDGVRDIDRGEQCDDGNMNSGDGCSNICQTETPGLCTNLSITPTSVVNGGNVTYTCSGTNVSSYSVQFSRPDGSVFQTLTTQNGSVTIPASPTGTYTAKCFVNGQTTTPAACQKTVENTTVTPICNNLTVTPTGVVNGGSVTYTCSGTNVSSYSIIARNPDGTIFASQTGAAGSIIIPASPLGTYSISCFVNGQITTPESCQKTVTNTTVEQPICTNLTVTPTSVVNGGNVTYTCTGNNVTSWSIQFSRPDGSVFQTLTTQNGSVTIPASPTGTYTAKCFVNGQTTTPASCQKTVENTTVEQPICTNLTVTPTSVVNGGDVTYTCTGNNVSSWSIQFSRPDGSVFQTLTTPTGSATIPATPTGTYTAKCFVNGQTTTPASCQKTVENSTNPQPEIDIDKRDTNSADLDGVVGNDTQTVTSGTAAVFKIRVTNNGTEDLRNLVLSDPIAPSCAGNVTLPSTYPGTWSNFAQGGSGNHTDNILQVGEWFEYTCNRTNTTAPYTNTATVNATGVTSGIPVDDTDPTPVLVPNTTPTCDNLTVSTTGTTVNYSCTGTNATSYRITQNGTQIGTSPTGSVNVGYGTFTFICYVNDSITSTACQKTVTTTTNPLIQVIKDDNDNHDDRQFLQSGAAATFTIVVKNPGTEPLSNVTLADQYAPECNRNSAQTQPMIVNVGNRDNRLDPGESFSYICTRANVDQYTFPNNENRICVDGQGSTSGIPVNSCDVTRIEFGGAICQNLQVSQNGNQVNAVCGPAGSYRLFVLNGPTVVNTYRNDSGQFNFTVGDGSYKLVCVRDGEQTVQPNCQKTITVNPKSNYCTISSSTQFGGAPLRTKLDCRSNTYAQCHIRIMKDGKPWGNVADCYADMVFEEKGVYDAICVIDGNEDQTCSTRVQVDIMTVIRTGPFLPILIILAMSTAGYLAYRRRKTV